jgi:hypothetical protein
MRALPPIYDPRPFRHAAVGDLFALAVLADRRMRSAIAHELDARAAQRHASWPTPADQSDLIDALEARRRMLNQNPRDRWSR